MKLDVQHERRVSAVLLPLLIYSPQLSVQHTLARGTQTKPSLNRTVLVQRPPAACKAHEGPALSARQQGIHREHVRERKMTYNPILLADNCKDWTILTGGHQPTSASAPDLRKTSSDSRTVKICENLSYGQSTMGCIRESTLDSSVNSTWRAQLCRLAESGFEPTDRPGTVPASPSPLLPPSQLDVLNF